jgi:hypothetical protein
MPVQRLDEVKAARDLDLTWKPKVSVTDQNSMSWR